MPTHVPLVTWALTAVGLLAVLTLDLVVIARRGHQVTIRDATRWVVFYVALAGAFGLGFFLLADRQAGEEFIAGYVTEYSLSIDNLFVFLIIMTRFAVPAIAQDKVLYIGIVLSLLLRGVCIAAGAAAIAAFSWVFYIFGALLVYTAVRLALEGENDEGDFKEYAVLKGLRRVLPTTPHFSDERFVTRDAGRRLFTPMIIVVCAIGLANVMFALDSIPAIFGLTQNSYIVFTANAFALMGLRQLYFLVGGLLERIVYLNVGLSFILAFVGVKLFREALHGSHVDDVGSVHLPEIGIAPSLLAIVGILVLTTLVSLGRSRRAPADGVVSD
jgi:TerC family integral membrane protein